MKHKKFADGGRTMPKEQPMMTPKQPERNPLYGRTRNQPYRQYEEALPDNALFGVERDSDVQRALEADELSPDIGPDITDRARTPYRKGGRVKKSGGGSISSASRRADGIAQRGKTKGRFV
jgi:hypothetical protein